MNDRAGHPSYPNNHDFITFVSPIYPLVVNNLKVDFINTFLKNEDLELTFVTGPLDDKEDVHFILHDHHISRVIYDERLFYRISVKNRLVVLIPLNSNIERLNDYGNVVWWRINDNILISVIGEHGDEIRKDTQMLLMRAQLTS